MSGNRAHELAAAIGAAARIEWTMPEDDRLRPWMSVVVGEEE